MPDQGNQQMNKNVTKSSLSAKYVKGLWEWLLIPYFYMN